RRCRRPPRSRRRQAAANKEPANARRGRASMPSILSNIMSSEVATLKAELTNDPTTLGYASTNNAGKARLLTTRPMIANPVQQAQVPAVMDTADLLSTVPNSELAQITDTALQTVSERIAAGDNVGVARWIGVATVKGWITSGTATALMAKVTSQVADPKWPAQVPGPNRLTVLLNRPVGGIAPAEVEEILGS